MRNDESTLSISDLVGNTPLVELTQLDAGVCRLFVKLESQNPSGSLKDRIAVSMIEAAVKERQLGAGGLIVEATSGNTGCAIALVALRSGFKTLFVVPDKNSKEKTQLLRSMGAEVRITRSDVKHGHPEYYQDLAKRLANEHPGACYLDQFSNPMNPLAHELTTGPEIWDQMGNAVDAIVLGVGTGGTLTGLGRFFKRVSPQTELVLADPEGSILAPYVRTRKLVDSGQWLVEGIGEDFIPPNADLSLVSRAYTIPDNESFASARLLLAKEGILGGLSTGTMVAAALRFCRSQTTPKRVVTLVYDCGTRYFSKLFNAL